MMAWTISMPAAITSSQPKNSMETTVAATARAIATTPISTRAMPKARNQPQLWTISAGTRISKAWISVMALLPPSQAAPSAVPTAPPRTCCGIGGTSLMLPSDAVKPPHARRSAVVDRLGRPHRAARGKVALPAGDARVVGAPAFVCEPEIEIGQRATDGDVSDGEGRVGERLGFALERRENRLALGGEGRKVSVRGMRALALVAQQQQEIEEAVAERLAAQGDRALLAVRRDELAPPVQAVEIFADEDRKSDVEGR